MTKKKKENKEEIKKYPLIDLVSEADKPYFHIILELSRAGLDKQLEEEIRLINMGLPVKKSLSKLDFEKILNGGDV